MSINLIFGPTANQVLDFALDGFPYDSASFYGLNPSTRAALFTNGLASGFPVDRGALFTQNNDLDLVTTIDTSYIATSTSTTTLSTDTSTTTTTPYTYSTSTYTPDGPTVTTTGTITSTTTLAGPTVTSTPAIVSVTSTAAPTCTVYNLSFAKDCCPTNSCHKGAPPRIATPKPTPAPKHSHHHRRTVGDDDGLTQEQQAEVNAKVQIAKDLGFYVEPIDANATNQRRQVANSADPAASSAIHDGTLFITSFRTSTVDGPTSTIFTATNTITEASSVIATETAPIPEAITVAADIPITEMASVTALPSTTTLVAITSSFIAAAPCATTSIPQFACPRKIRSQNKLRQLEQNFLDRYKKKACPRAPLLSVTCQGDSQVYNY